MEQIRINRYDHRRRIQSRNRPQRPTKKLHRPRPLVVRADRFIFKPLRPRFDQIPPQPRHRRRPRCLRKHHQPRFINPLHRRFKRIPRPIRPLLPAICHRPARAIRIINIQHRPLQIHIRRSLVQRMRRISIHLDRPPIKRNRHHPLPHPAHFHRRRIMHRHAIHPIRRTMRIRRQFILRPPPATRQPRQRSRRSHDFQKIPPRFPAPDKFRRLRRKFLRHKFTKFRRIRQLIQAAPVFLLPRGFSALHRWHVMQSVFGLT